MAGVNEKPVSSGINWGGYTNLGNGLAMYVGTGVFVTTGATVVIYHPFGGGAIFSAIAQFNETTLDTDDTHIGFKVGTSANELSRDTTYGTLKSVTPGAAIVHRNGTSGLSGAAFSIIMIGRAKS